MRTEEYRKETFEKILPDGIGFIMWRPDKKADHMLMVWDLWIEHGCRVSVEYKKRIKQWQVSAYSWVYDAMGIDKSIFIATKKAFAEYAEHDT